MPSKGSLSAVRRPTALAVLLLLASAGAPGEAGQLRGDTQPKLAPPLIVKELHKGGHVIYFRHGTTSDLGEKDVSDADLDYCDRQRNLSDAGQAQTRGIGEAFRRLQIPVGPVYASPYCRCLDTARNIFGKVEKSRALHFAIHLKNTDRASVTAQLVEVLGTPPPRGTNVALVSHTANLQEAVGIWPKPEGVAHVFKPTEDGYFTYVGVVPPEAWQEVARAGPDGGGGGWLSGWRRWFNADR